jgi:hypothetical protein
MKKIVTLFGLWLVCLIYGMFSIGLVTLIATFLRDNGIF